ncbi:unnamed protein product, partial [Meganyctiphanes norvegica]
ILSISSVDTKSLPVRMLFISTLTTHRCYTFIIIFLVHVQVSKQEDEQPVNRQLKKAILKLQNNLDVKLLGLLEDKLLDFLDKKLSLLFDGKLSNHSDNKLSKLFEAKLSNFLDKKLSNLIDEKLPDLHEEKLTTVNYKIRNENYTLVKVVSLEENVQEILNDTESKLLQN